MLVIFLPGTIALSLPDPELMFLPRISAPAAPKPICSSWPTRSSVCEKGARVVVCVKSRERVGRAPVAHLFEQSRFIALLADVLLIFKQTARLGRRRLERIS